MDQREPPLYLSPCTVLGKVISRGIRTVAIVAKDADHIGCVTRPRSWRLHWPVPDRHLWIGKVVKQCTPSRSLRLAQDIVPDPWAPISRAIPSVSGKRALLAQPAAEAVPAGIPMVLEQAPSTFAEHGGTGLSYERHWTANGLHTGQA